ncbi:MAG TPA: ABC transporter ATP-binding protein [Candidatus Scatomonas merdavium]|nr:ABC transporter ATP-binding protein [Candidatus Scatomonas merdavium]
MIEVRNLVKRYGSHTAVDHLSFRVEEGQIYGFLGPNGAGKSTTMNIITGYLAFNEGEVLVDGHSIMEEPEEAKQCMGYLPELPPLYPDMTVREYLVFAADLKKILKEKRREQVEKVMDIVKISDMENRLIKNLSKGYRQRVGLAQALLGDPKIVILDEPTVGLDPKQIIEIREMIRSLKERHTVILSSHILSEVSAVCDYVMIINHGRLVASDTPDRLSEMALGSNTLELIVKGQMGVIVSSLGMIPEIEDVNYSASEEEGCVKAVIKTPRDVDIREKIFFKMAGIGCPILSMQSTKMSLEDVFLELTEEGEREDFRDSDASEEKEKDGGEEKFAETEESEKTDPVPVSVMSGENEGCEEMTAEGGSPEHESDL